MRKHILLAAAASLALAPAAFAQDSQKSPGGGQLPAAGAQTQELSTSDKKFVDSAAVGGLFEVQSSELAEKNAENAEVKDFASLMVKDHGDANEELKSLAQKLGADVPDQLDAKHAQMLDSLQGLSGAEFDREYIQVQTDAHNEAVTLFSKQSEAQDGNAELAAWAKKTLPILEEHQSHLGKLSAAGGVAAGEDSSGSGRASTKEPLSKEPMRKSQ